MPTRIQIRRGTASEWSAANPVLAAGEEGVETDTGVHKIGDGSTAWNTLLTPNNTIYAPKKLSGSASLNFPSIAAHTGSELTIAVTGAAVGDIVALAPPAALEAGLIGQGRVSATGVVTIRLMNVTTGAIDPAAATWGVAIIK